MKGNEVDPLLLEEQRITKRKPVDIPINARAIKAKFWSEPDRAKVKEIARYITETGEAHSHPDVTYAAVPKDADVRFLEVFSLADKFKYDEDKWCVCAACPHDLPQFKNDGVVCWLPEEGTIKVVGWHCFKRRNPEAHKKAADRYNAQKKARNDEAYLLGRLFHVSILLVDLDHDIAVAKAFEKVRAAFHLALHEHGLRDLPRHVAYGKLRLHQRRMDGLTGKTEYAIVEGDRFLSNSGTFSTRLAAIRKALAALDFGGGWEQAVYAMNDKDKSRNVDIFAGSMTSWQRIIADLERMRAFIRPAAGTTMERWSLEPETSFPMFFDYAEDCIRIGMSPTRNAVIDIPRAAREPFATLPEMGPSLKS